AGAAVPHVRVDGGVPVDLSRPVGGGPSPRLDRHGGAERRDPRGPAGRLPVRTGRGRRAGPPGRPGGDGLLERPAAHGGTVPPGAGPAARAVRGRGRGVVRRRRRPRPGRVPLLRRPHGRHDQDVRLPCEPDGDRGGGLRVGPGPRRGRGRPPGRPAGRAHRARGHPGRRRGARPRPAAGRPARAAAALPRPEARRDPLRAAPVAQRQVRPGPAARGGGRVTATPTTATGQRPAVRDRPMVAAFGRRDGRLTVGGVPVDLLAERVGRTPFFAYDRGLLTERVHLVRAALPPDIQLSYAVKANPMPALVGHLSALVDSFDVASAQEMHTALNTPTPPELISFAGPGKTPAELRQAVAAGVTIVLESATEAARVTAIGRELSVQPRVVVRVNPDFALKGSGMRLGGGPQQFGVDCEQVPALLKRLDHAGLDVLGFHVFAGSQNLRADALAEAQRRTVDLVLRLARTAPAPVRYVNLGGGFGIPYTDADRPLDLDAVGRNLADLYERGLRPHLPRARVVVELGRYLV